MREARSPQRATHVRARQRVDAQAKLTLLSSARAPPYKLESTSRYLGWKLLSSAPPYSTLEGQQRRKAVVRRGRGNAEWESAARRPATVSGGGR